MPKFTLYSPNARSVELRLYREAQGGAPEHRYNLEVAGNGWWRLHLYCDLMGWYYTYRVQTADGWQRETPGPWATAVGVNGARGAIIDLEATNPEGWEADCRPPLCASPIIYELHHRDFSISHTSGIHHKGRYLALTESGTRTADNLATGIDHLTELGITHVQLLPSFDFSSIDETEARVPHYNWGYDPQNYNVPEGSYATDAVNPSVRIREFKMMVAALHKAGIRVVLDVVYNHVASVAASPLECAAPGIYFRRWPDGTLANGSGCGNETASEHEAMRRFIVESVAYWAEEYHIDGFRFDLMALHDIATMKAVCRRLHAIDPTICVYGEGWAAAPSPLPARQAASKANMAKLPAIAAFGDELRDGLRGPFADDKLGGFLLGNAQAISAVKRGIVGATNHPQLADIHPPHWAKRPAQMLSYVSCHDDLCLYDRLLSASPTLSTDEAERLSLLAHTAVLTAQATPFIFSGEELLRSKRGVRNSYNSSDMINAIDWRGKSLHYQLFTALRRLIHLRRQHPLFQLPTAKAVAARLRFLDVGNHVAVAFTIDAPPSIGDSWKQAVVVLNADERPLHLALPLNRYTLYLKSFQSSLSGLTTLHTDTLEVPPHSPLIAAVVS